ncbi:DUF1294 domain-containing protein [Arcanobacterium phocae]
MGGAPGGLIGMRMFRHKLHHWYFSWGFRTFIVLHVCLIVIARLTMVF